MRSFSEWMIDRLDEAKRKFGKARPTPSPRSDIDRWIKSVEDLAKDLEELKKLKKKAGERKRSQELVKRVMKDPKKDEKKIDEKKPKEDQKPEQEANEKTKNLKVDSRPRQKSLQTSKVERPVTQIQGNVKRDVNKQARLYKRGGHSK